MPLKLARRASADLADIYAYGLERWGRDQAERYAANFWATANFIEANPFASRERTDTVVPVRVRRFGSHLIIYRIDHDGILVIRVAHGRSDWQAILS